MKNNRTFMPVTLPLIEGDILTSKKGILTVSMHSENNNKYFVVKKAKIMKNGFIECLGKKEEVNAKLKKEKNAIDMDVAKWESDE